MDSSRADGGVKFSRMYDDHTDSDVEDVAFRLSGDRAEWQGTGSCCCPKDAHAKQLASLLVFTALLVVGLVAALVVLNATSPTSQPPAATTDKVQQLAVKCLTPDCITAASEILSKMNLTASPCDDFYEYSCGCWMKHTFFPPEKAKWSSFSEVYTSNTRLLKKLLEGDGSQYEGTTSSTAIRKVKDYYSACMNRSAYESRGAAPLKELIKSLGSWSLSGGSGEWNKDTWNLEATLVLVHKLDITPLFMMAVGADDMNSSVNSIMFQQSGLTLSSRDQYTANGTAMLSEAFVQFGIAIVKLLSDDGSAFNQAAVEQRLREIWALESRLAGIFLPQEELRNPLLVYHTLTVQQLQERLGPAVNLTSYLSAMLGKAITGEQTTIVYTPTYFEALKDVITEYNATDEKRSILADYMVWLVVTSTVSYLTEEFRQSHLILSSVSDGVTSLSTRWELCVSRADSTLGFASGALYIAANFLPESKKQVEDILSLVKESFTDSFPSVDWMDEMTKAAAMAKADYIVSKVGYPDWLPNATALDNYYDELSITPNDQFANFLSSQRFSVNYRLSKFGSPPDRNAWTMVPAEVNAYYSPSFNAIVFPAGILQKPFYDARYPVSANFGGVGSVVGHELTHAFDDEGGLYDKFGNLRSWWQNASMVAFQNRSQCMSDQYSKFKVGNELVNGRLTLGENIADNGGVKASYTALMKWLAANRLSGDSVTNLPGLNLTHSQLFYVSYAQVWCSYYQPAFAQLALHTDPHSPARYRVIGPLSNSEYFATAFSCPAGSAMVPADKCTVW